MRTPAALAISAVLLASSGCGSSGTESAPVPHTTEQAESYALDVAEERTGERERNGCLSVTKVKHGEYVNSGSAAEENAGCIFSAAFAGCSEGMEGESFLPQSYRREFPEPGLQTIYREARRHCTKTPTKKPRHS